MALKDRCFRDEKNVLGVLGGLAVQKYRLRSSPWVALGQRSPIIAFGSCEIT